jgi:hypothetical protein
LGLVSRISWIGFDGAMLHTVELDIFLQSFDTGVYEKEQSVSQDGDASTASTTSGGLPSYLESRRSKFGLCGSRHRIEGTARLHARDRDRVARGKLQVGQFMEMLVPLARRAEACPRTWKAVGQNGPSSSAQ